ncbi:MAG: hypothetical protein ABI690_23675 [Chloroflexota bacterium]
MHDEIFKTLEARWHELYDQYEVVKAALPPIVRWEWTNRSRYDPRPFYYHRYHLPRGRIIKSPPEHDRPWKYYYEHGFDNVGRVIVERWYIGDKNLGETFYSYMLDKTEITTYSQHQGRYLLSSISHCTLDGNLMQNCASLTVTYYSIDPTLPYPMIGQVAPYRGQGVETATAEEIWTQLLQQEHAVGWGYEEYRYEARRLTHIQDYSRHSLGSEYLIVYDTAGNLQKITRSGQSYEDNLLYRKREAGETRAVLAERMITKLVEAIPQIVAAAKFTEPLYCLSLNYYSDIIYSFPPRLLPNFESDRQKTIHDHPPAHLRSGLLWVTIWDDEAHPDIPDPPLPITDPEVLEACENFNADMRRGRDYGFMVRTLREVARELNKLDWSQYAPVTSDFIVFDCDDTEHTRPAVSLRYSGATKAQIADWRKRGLL